MGQSTKYVDLSRDGLELEKNFDSIISRLPDLCKPAAVCLAGEHDYFRETRKLQLAPFRKQKFFDTYVREQTDVDQNKTQRNDLVEFFEYPYTNPMPKCMLTDDNLDNLQNIIVTSLDIEWQMLTPKRPEDDYELEFFDKLVALHRQRFRQFLSDNNLDIARKGQQGDLRQSTELGNQQLSRCQSGHSILSSASESLFFRHTRHRNSAVIPLTGQQERSQLDRKRTPLSSTICHLGVTIRNKFRSASSKGARRRSQKMGRPPAFGRQSRRSIQMVGQPFAGQWTIPKLTLTCDEPLGEREMDGAKSTGRRLSSGQQLLDGNRERSTEILVAEDERESDRDGDSFPDPLNFRYEFFSRRSVTVAGPTRTPEKEQYLDSRSGDIALDELGLDIGASLEANSGKSGDVTVLNRMMEKLLSGENYGRKTDLTTRPNKRGPGTRRS